MSAFPQPLRHSSKVVSIFVAIALTLTMAFVAGQSMAGASHQDNHLPADKFAVSGNDFAVFDTGAPQLIGAGQFQDEASLFHIEQYRTSNGVDLIFQVTLECALWTDVFTTSSAGVTESSRSDARIFVWVEVDKEPVTVGDEGDHEVTFCDRSYRRDLTNDNEEDVDIETYIATKAANAFNWIELSLDNGIHEIEVLARVELEVEGRGQARGIVGNRTLVVEPMRTPVGMTKS